MNGMKTEIGKLVTSEIKRASDNHKMLFVSSERHQADIQKLKRDVSKQVKTGLEEATFDTIKMV